MMEILQYEFMQRAFIAGIMVAITCPLIGIFIVLKRLSMIGDTLSHASLAGIAAGMLWGFYPFWGALIFTLIGAVAIEKLRKTFSKYAEISNSIILSAGIGIAVVMIGLAKGFNTDLMGYMFGSIAAVSSKDIYIMGILSVIIILSVIVLHKKLFYIAFDEEGAQVSGVSVNFLNMYLTILTGLTVVVSMRIVGIFMVSSMLVVPVAAAIQTGQGFIKTTAISVIFALISVIFGLVLSYYFDIAPGGTIVLLSVGILVGVLFIKALRKRK
ncbi:metal ABC transporter permease [Lutispora thermophila]|uniref:Zinc transport system permease protein n=1 Tax=Lutispora thermophila DSM 19022 TaxID=1122184 RepID=A0A1M6IME0_9FIRM|nr:metal ABC transporter permease [Lutispora thermophila]SHJ35610.1 zinc transport system permease protein [Lutispora thermophila DSM 19022]